MRAQISMPYELPVSKASADQRDYVSSQRVVLEVSVQRLEDPYDVYLGQFDLNPDAAVKLYQAMGRLPCVQEAERQREADLEQFVRDGQDYDAFIGAAEQEASISMDPKDWTEPDWKHQWEQAERLLNTIPRHIVEAAAENLAVYGDEDTSSPSTTGS